jgi:hypothetical protein
MCFSLALGTVVGIAQWVALRQWVSKAGWWILASSLGWAAAFIPLIWVDWAVAQFAGGILLDEVVAVSADMVGGAGYGVITGWVVARLWRRPVPLQAKVDAA